MSKTRQIIFDRDVQDKILSGVKKLAKAVKTTLGPKGCNVVIEQEGGRPSITKDGVTVASSISLEDKYENLGCSLVKEAASNTADSAGDGTTTATLLTEAIYEESVRALTTGANPIELKRGIDAGVAVVVRSLDEQKVLMEKKSQIENVATISANNDPDVGKFISETIEEIGKDGVINLDTRNNLSMGLTREIVSGYQFDKGYLNAYMVTDTEKMITEYSSGTPSGTNPVFVFLCKNKIQSARHLIKILEAAQGISPTFSILLICEDLGGEALATLVVNKIKGQLRAVAVKAPSYGDRREEMMKDIAAITGATYVSEDLGMSLDEINPNWFGYIKQISVTKDNTTLFMLEDDEDITKAKEQRVDEIRAAMNAATSEYDKDKLKERLAKLTASIAVIRVGAATETEMREKRDSIDDAIRATRAAIEEGIVSGGGVAYIKALKKLKDFIATDETLKNKQDRLLGANILYRALTHPLYSIVENAEGENASFVVGKVVDVHMNNADSTFGYDASSGTYVDSMIDSGIIDPKKVARVALINAASAATMLLSTKCAITFAPSKNDDMDLGDMGGMHPSM